MKDKKAKVNHASVYSMHDPIDKISQERCWFENLLL